MANSSDSVDWQAIRAGTFLYETNCWTTCGGGFCCSNNHPDLQFQLIPTQGTTLLYMQGEYEFLRELGRVPEVATTRQPPHELSLDFGGPRPLTVIQTPCHLLGDCDDVIDKPLLCKTYPFIPVLDIDGELAELVPASIFELTFDVIGERAGAVSAPGDGRSLPVLGAESPCTVRQREADYSSSWREDPAVLAPLRHPYVMLYLQAAKHFAANYADALRANEQLMDLDGSDFWKHWELQYLGKRLIDVPRLKQDVYDSYRVLKERYGEFLL